MMHDEWLYRGTLVYLTEDEADEAVQLWRKGRERAAAESEQKRLDALDQEAKNRATRFQDLVGKETLTEDEKREFGFLREIRKGRVEQLQQLEEAYGRDLAAVEQRYQDADRRALDELRKAAQRVGERRGLDYVFTREALLFGGVDITQDVIDDLQANVPALARMGGGVEEGAAP